MMAPQGPIHILLTFGFTPGFDAQPRGQSYRIVSIRILD